MAEEICHSTKWVLLPAASFTAWQLSEEGDSVREDWEEMGGLCHLLKCSPIYHRVVRWSLHFFHFLNTLLWSRHATQLLFSQVYSNWSYRGHQRHKGVVNMHYQVYFIWSTVGKKSIPTFILKVLLFWINVGLIIFYDNQFWIKWKT